MELKINPQKASNRLVKFLRTNIRKRGFRRAVVGISGGTDSSVAAYLCVKALGARNVLGVILPYKITSKKDVTDAQNLAKSLKIKTEFIDITPMVDRYFKKFPGASRIRRGNKMARERMSVLYDLSKSFKALVVGASNRSEILMGYGTIHGDCAWALGPLAGLYKTQVKQLAEYLDIPKNIIHKTPSAGLWKGQTDEGELRIKYERLDRLLFYLVDKKYSETKLRKLGFGVSVIRRIKAAIQKNRFKSEPPLIAKLT